MTRQEQKQQMSRPVMGGPDYEVSAGIVLKVTSQSGLGQVVRTTVSRSGQMKNICGSGYSPKKLG